MLPIGNPSLNFGKGKKILYSDYDRTLCPATTTACTRPANSPEINLVRKSFEDFSNLLKELKGQFTFIKTSGRNLSEYETVHNFLKDRNATIPEAERIVTADGSEEFINTRKNNGKFPYNKINNERYEEIKKQSNWDYPKLEKTAIESIEEQGLNWVKAETTLDTRNYGKRTIFAHPEKITPSTVIIRDFGRGQLFLGFHPEVEQTKREIIEQKLHQTFKKNNISYMTKKSLKNEKCGHFPTLSFQPVINGKPLTKLYDTKKAVQRAIKEKDLIIVAGDGMNDFEMLNPLSYLDLPKDIEPTDFKKATNFIEKNAKYQEQLKSLPLVSIIVKRFDQEKSPLEILHKFFKEKTLIIEEGKLADGVRKAIKSHPLK